MTDKVNWKSGTDVIFRSALLMSGLFFYGLAIAITLRSGLGLGSWDVLHKGFSLHSPLTLGQAGQLTGLVIIVIAFIMGIKPGVGTLANMYFIGFWIDLIIQAQFVPEAAQYGLAAQLLWVAIALVLLGMGSGLYIKAGMGVGPRDSFMLALVKRTGWRVALCRAIIEVTVCLVGWLLGGPVGLATVIVAFGVGPSVELGFRICRVKVQPKDESFSEPNPAVEAAQKEPVNR